jgi:spore maturation protein CgeB
MKAKAMNIVILGLSITSSWGNGHATTYRSLTRALHRRGHSLLFLERDVPWYADQRDLTEPPYCPTRLYSDLEELKAMHGRAVAEADLVIVGSCVPEGIAVGEWVIETANGVTAFYDIDTPVTLAALSRGDCTYLSTQLIPRYHLFLSFAGGPLLQRLERHYGAAMARPLYCSVDPEAYYPESDPRPALDLGYMGTYSPDRQPGLETLLLDPARAWPQGHFAVVGPQYPEGITWPDNVRRRDHLPPDQHRGFYNDQRYTLNLTRSDMVELGHSPSVRLFEAAACGTPIISDYWEGLDSLFRIGEEIEVAETTAQVLQILQTQSETSRRRQAEAARARVLGRHTSDHRAAELEQHYLECLSRRQRRTA